MKNKLSKTLLSFISVITFIMAIPFAAHAIEVTMKLVPSPDGNILFIRNQKPGRLYDLLRHVFRYDYQNIKIVGKMSEDDFRWLSFAMSSACKTIDLSGVDSRFMPKSTFCGKSSLEKFILPSNLEVIEESCFCKCRNLKTVIFPKSLKYIGNSCFALCGKLKLNVPIDRTISEEVLYKSPKVFFTKHVSCVDTIIKL